MFKITYNYVKNYLKTEFELYSKKVQKVNEMNVSEYIKDATADKNILILGFGREGRSTYNLLKKIGGYKTIGIADLNQVDDVDEVTYSGADYQRAISEYDLVFKSPGVVIENHQHSSKIISQTDVIIECYKHSMIGITGTKGKSTTTSLIYHVLEKCGKKPVLMGNIGIPAFDAIEGFEDDNIIVYELSCHQLEFAKKSPHRGVLLNIYPEHLDHYGTFEKYADAKRNIYNNMISDDLLVCGYEFSPKDIKAKTVTVSMSDDKADFYVSDNMIFDIGGKFDFEPQANLFGIHNMYNIAVAYAVCADCGVNETEFNNALKSFNPLPHRLELFAEIDGVKYFDDSISTIPETAIKAVSSIKNAGTLILGGMDRGVELDSLCDFLIKNPVENIILMPDTGNIIFEKLDGLYGGNLHKTHNLHEAVAVAKKVTKPGFACILSPAAASYGFFKNFEERGDCFKNLVLGK